jgi:chromosome partitioning protein
LKIINKNLALAYKKRNDKDVLNKAKLKFDKEMMEFFPLTSEDGNLIFSYESKIIELRKGSSEQEIELKKENEIKKIVKNISLVWERKRENYYLPFVSIPLGIVKDMGINRDNKELSIFFNEDEDKKFIIKVKEDSSMKSVPITLANGEVKEVEKRYLEEIEFDKSYVKYLKRNGTVVTVKVGKGGIGKTFITTQLAVGLAEYGLKILVITSDPQNDIIGMCYPMGEYPEYNGGLKKWVTEGNGDLVKLRPNVDFVPLEDNEFNKTFENKFHDFIENMKNKYDYILIDSMPMMSIDKVFHKEVDKVIVPLFADKFTVDGAVKAMLEIGLEKVSAVIFNFYKNTNKHKRNYEAVKSYIKETNILVPEPIKDLTYLEQITEDGKTIWDNKKVIKKEDGSEEIQYTPKSADEIREIFTQVIEKIITETYKEPEEIRIDL